MSRVARPVLQTIQPPAVSRTLAMSGDTKIDGLFGRSDMNPAFWGLADIVKPDLHR
jgi:hypothetical protein